METSSRRRIGVLAVVALCAVSCEDFGDGFSGDANGDLGYANFRWECSGAGDLACEPDWEDEFPRAIALGSRFDADFSLSTRIPDELDRGSLVFASNLGVRATSGDFEAMEPGRVTLMALTSDDAVADFAAVDIRPVDALYVVYDCDSVGGDAQCGRSVSEVQVVGEPIDVRVQPSGDGEALVGQLDYEWEVLTPGRLEMSGGDDNDNDVTLLPVAPGPAELVVRTGEVERHLTLMIQAANNDIDSSGPKRTRPGETDSGSDDGTETDTDTDSGTGGETDTDTDMGTSSSGGTE